jgi:hypothetical protein
LMPVTASSVLDHLIALALTAMDVHDHIMLDIAVKINTYLAIPKNTLKIGLRIPMACLQFQSCARLSTWCEQLRGCPPACGLPLYATALFTPSAKAAYWLSTVTAVYHLPRSPELAGGVLSAAA